MTGPEKSALSLNLLGFRAGIEGPVRLVRDLARYFGPTPPGDRDVGGAAFEIRGGDPGRGWHRIYRDGRSLWSTADEREAAPAAAWTVRTSAIKALAARYLLLHAGSVALNGRGVILSAPAGAGKSTLTAALLTAGFGYLSDEVGAIGAGDLKLHPFPGSPAIKEGSVLPLARLRGPARDESGRFAPERRLFGEKIYWLDVPGSFCVTEAVSPGHIVFPAYVAGAAARLEPLPRSEALKLLAAQAFNAGAHTPDGMETLVGLLREVECARLVFGDLAEAVRLVADVAEGAADAAHQQKQKKQQKQQTYAGGRRP